MSKSAPFPPISVSPASPLLARQTSPQQQTSLAQQPPQSQTPLRQRRRKSSSLGGDPRGDTGVGAIATNLSPQATLESPTSPIAPRSNQEKPTRERKRKKAKRFLTRWKRLALRHTWLVPLIIVLILLAAYAVSAGEHNPLHSAIFLSYADPALNERTNTLPAHLSHVTQYGKGRKDFAFVAFYTIVFTFTREFLMQRLLRPIAIRLGIRSRGKQARFLEQAYTAVYFAIFGPYGMYVMSRSPVWYFNTNGMFVGFPHRAHEAHFKAYYLLQAAYWAQQGLVLMLQLEKPRKDFRELVLHHIITLSLIGLSYRFHFTYMGLAVYITHDISDFFLATSKVLNYIDSPFTIPYFVVFMGVWAYLRHYINLRILTSLFPPMIAGYDMRNFFGPSTGTFSTVGDFTLNWETQQYKCWIAQLIAFPLLATLQAVNLFWFALIIRILWRYLRTGEEKDERSEDEVEEGEEGVEPVAVKTTADGKRINGKGGDDGEKHAGAQNVTSNGTPQTTGSQVEAKMNGNNDAVRRKR